MFQDTPCSIEVFPGGASSEASASMILRSASGWLKKDSYSLIVQFYPSCFMQAIECPATFTDTICMPDAVFCQKSRYVMTNCKFYILNILFFANITNKISFSRNLFVFFIKIVVSLQNKTNLYLINIS